MIKSLTIVKGEGKVVKNKIISISVVILTVVVMALFVIFSNFVEHNGLILENISQVNGIKYGYNTGNDYGLYCSKEIDGEYIKISDYAPLGKDSVFIDDDYLYFTSKAGKLIAVSLIDYKNTIIDTNNIFVKLLGMNSGYLIGKIYNDKKDTAIIEKKNWELYDVILKNGNEFVVNEEYMTFKVRDELASYNYYFDNKKLEKQK